MQVSNVSGTTTTTERSRDLFNNIMGVERPMLRDEPRVSILDSVPPPQTSEVAHHMSTMYAVEAVRKFTV